MAEPRVALLSLEPWDTTWRRNQHLATQLVRSGAVASLHFVAPPRGGLAIRAVTSRPVDGVEVITPPLLVPRRYGGYAVLARWLRRRLREVDIVWVNDPVAGRAALAAGRPALYDVTDDWRCLAQPRRDRRRIIVAENALAQRAVTVVCSAELAERWRARYGVEAVVVPNGVDVEALRESTPVPLPGPPPHAVYVGTQHANRLDVGLVTQLAARMTVHLVGPGRLDTRAAARLDAAGVRRHGPVPHEHVPGWLLAADVLVSPHVVNGFTRSLDAIKAHEYLATDRPVVATPSSGFQALSAPGLTVAEGAAFVEACAAARGSFDRPAPASWEERADLFAAALRRSAGAG